MNGCPCGFKPVYLEDWSADWHRRHRDHHLATFPDVDEGTKRNLAGFNRARVAARTSPADAQPTPPDTPHTAALRPAGADVPLRPSRKAVAIVATLLAGGPGTPGTAPLASSRRLHHLDQAGPDAVGDLGLVHAGGAADLDHPVDQADEAVGELGGGGCGVGGHVDSKHHSVTVVNNISRRDREAL